MRTNSTPKGVTVVCDKISPAGTIIYKLREMGWVHVVIDMVVFTVSHSTWSGHEIAEALKSGGRSLNVINYVAA
jgi:hypothetical protein